MSDTERETLIELICAEQTHMIVKDNTSSDRYMFLEQLKVKIKDMRGS